MSQRAVEGLLGRLVTDRRFRRQFYLEPGATCTRESLELTMRELSAVLALEEPRIEEFAGWLDAKIVRAGASDKDDLLRRRPAATLMSVGARK